MIAVVAVVCAGAWATFKSYQAGRVAERNERLALDSACEFARALTDSGLPEGLISYRPRTKICEIRVNYPSSRLNEPKAAKVIADYRDSRQKLRGWEIPPVVILPYGIEDAKPYLTIS